MDPDKVQSIIDWPQPTNVTEVQSFLGFANFYRRFITNYSTIVEPLTNFTKKDKPFQWDINAQNAFEQLKYYFITALVLVSYN